MAETCSRFTGGWTYYLLYLSFAACRPRRKSGFLRSLQTYCEPAAPCHTSQHMHACMHACRHTYIHTDRQTDRQTDTIAVAGSDAAKHHVERMQAVRGNERRIDALGPIHVHAWASIVNAAVGSAGDQGGCGRSQRAFLRFVESITKPGSDLNSIAPHAHVARFRKARDKGTVKLRLACRSDWCKVFESLDRAPVASGTKRKLGQAPRGGLERRSENFWMHCSKRTSKRPVGLGTDTAVLPVVRPCRVVTGRLCS